MQVPDEVRKCVAFLGCLRNSGHAIYGTAFFVGYPLEGIDNFMATYVVTARHVIDAIKERAVDGNTYLRLNTREQGAQYARLPISHWFFCDDSRIDVAVAPLSMAEPSIEWKAIPLDAFLSPETVANDAVGPGDDLFFPGLFSEHPGERTNIPIMRVGNIAAMPDEPIATRWGVVKPPYLVEARSIGGLSGSPVFWHRGATRIRQGGLHLLGDAAFFLLGLVHGHFAERSTPWDGIEEAPTDMAETRSVNMGIAIVVPAHDILSTLNMPVFQEQRRAMKQNIPANSQSDISIPETGAPRQGGSAGDAAKSS
jgi:hypothetical protein